MSDDASDGTQEPPPSHRRFARVVGVVLVLGLIAAAVPVALALRRTETTEFDPGSARQRLGDLPEETSQDGPRAEGPAVRGPRGEGELAAADEGSGDEGSADEEGVDDEREPAQDAAPSDVDGAVVEDVVDADGEPVAAAPSAPVEYAQEYRTFLIVGSDARDGYYGARADVLLVAMLPEDDADDPVLFSVPRDLWVDNPCTGGRSRINAGLNGCDRSASGFELTAVMVENFTGVGIEHVVGVDFEGFTQVIDAVGGVEICVDDPVRGYSLSLPAGCTQADGQTALAWVRSRTTEAYVDGRWRRIWGVNDLTRNERQQDVMLQLLDQVGSFETATNLYGFAQGISDSVTMSSDLSLIDGARIAWGVRGEADDVRQIDIPVAEASTTLGDKVLLAAEPFPVTLEREVGITIGGEAAGD